jgi:simple sugar transport system ATP-binding protein
VAFLALHHVSKTFGGTRALKSIDWDVSAGEVHCLVGENGCGKSTLIKIVTGVHAPDAGSLIEIDGVEHPMLTPAMSRAKGIQVIYQDLSLFPNLSVAENIAMGSNLRGLAKGVEWRRMREIAAQTMARLGVDLPHGAAVSALSIAQRQIVAICRGLAESARLIFMDEPTASLTRAEVDSLLATVAKLKADGIAVVFVSHKLDEVTEIAERVTVMRDGAKVGTFPVGEVDQHRIGELMTGKSFHHTVNSREPLDTEPVLAVMDLSRVGEYRDVSFELKRGEVLGLIGLLGAGRTELALTLFGMTRPDSGAILIDGRPVRFRSNQDAIDAGISYVSEDRLNLGLNLRQSIADNAVLSVLGKLANRLGVVARADRLRVASEGIQRLNIKIGGLELPVSTLSGGNQQRVVLAKWLATDPKILILDSPTVGVDVGNKQAIYAIIRELSGRGVSVIVISDEIAEAREVCDRVIHMKDGRLLDQHVPAHDREDELKELVYG